MLLLCFAPEFPQGSLVSLHLPKTCRWIGCHILSLGVNHVSPMDWHLSQGVFLPQCSWYRLHIHLNLTEDDSPVHLNVQHLVMMNSSSGLDHFQNLIMIFYCHRRTFDWVFCFWTTLSSLPSGSILCQFAAILALIYWFIFDTYWDQLTILMSYSSILYVFAPKISQPFIC